MTRITWDGVGKRLFTAGVDRGVLYPSVGPGLPWNGLVSVTETTVDTEFIKNYYDGLPFHSTQRPGSFAATLEAYSYPVELNRNIRQNFGFSYRTFIGDDVDGVDRAYQIHIVYNARIDLSDKAYSSIAESTDLITFSWELSTRPEAFPGIRQSAHFIVDSRFAYDWVMTELEETLYGGEFGDPSLPSLIQLVDIFENGSILKITDNGDGTWTAEGPDYIVKTLGTDFFEISWPSAVWISPDTYKLSSL